MSKRKQKAPQKIREEKRRCLTWNMMDGVEPSGSLSVFSDNDPVLLHEIQESQASTSKGDNCDFIRKEDYKLAFSNAQVQQAFQNGLKEADYCVTIKQNLDVKEKEWYALLAKMEVRLLSKESLLTPPQRSLPDCKEFRLYSSSMYGQSMIYFEPEDENKPSESGEIKNVVFWFVDTDVPCEVLGALDSYNSKQLQVTSGQYDSDQHTLELNIYIRQGIIVEPKFPCEAFKLRKHNIQVQKLLSYFYGKAVPSYDTTDWTRKHDVDTLYQIVKEIHNQEEITLDIDVQHPSLVPVLREYQKNGVRWMLSKEKCNRTEKLADNQLHMMYDTIESPDGTVLYYNKYAGILTLTPQMSVLSPPGGILADEMGLGKTVEVLACLLLHKRDESELVKPVPQPMEKQTTDASVPCQIEPEICQADHTAYTLKEETSDLHTEVSDVTSTSLDRCDLDKVVSDIGNIEDVEPQATEEGSTSLHGRGCEAVCLNEDSPLESCDLEPEVIVNIYNNSAKSKPCNNMETLNVNINESTSNLTGCDKYNICDNSVTDGLNDVSMEMMSDHSRQNSRNSATIDTEINSKFKESLIGDNTAEQSEMTENNLKAADVSEDKMDSTFLESDKNEDDKSTNSSVTEPSGGKRKGKRKRRRRKKWTRVKPKRKRSIEAENNSLCEVLTSDSVKTEGLMSAPVEKKKCRSSDFVELVGESEYEPKNIITPLSSSLKPKEFFECICGMKSNKKRDKKLRVQCSKCRLWQHAACVNYDVDDPLKGEFKCPHCHVSSPPIPSGATLIISPSSICHQWVDEILKHIRSQSLRVFVYLGVNKQGFIQPATLAQQDIVITTYETLRKEIDYVDLPHSNSETGRKFRHPKRFMAIPSPITAVEWWRICLDEAQMVECTATKTAEMALRLRAVNRWCVTGTPIQKSVSDLYGLLLFLGVDPYWVKQWWNKMLYEPFCCGVQKPLHDLVASVLWRTVKKDVIDQIDLQEQTEHIHWLTFSPVEDHFYRRQYQECIATARRDLSKWTDLSVKLSSLDRHTVNQLLHPLLRLRQACCHPQAVRGEFLPLQKTTMTMEELLESLTKKAQTEGEESHRQLVAALNGLAGLHIINRQHKEAVDHYREVLRSVEEHKNELRTDDLQLLHAMYNLDEVLQLNPAGVDPTLRDGQLRQQCKELKEKYLAKTAGKVSSCQEALVPTQQSLRDLTNKLRYGREWWLEVVTYAEQRQLDYRLTDAVQNDLRKDVVEDSRNMPKTIANLFQNTGGLELVLQPRIEALQSARDKLCAGIKKLCQPLNQDRINEAVKCCLRPVEGIANSCAFCQVNKLFQDYESKLFHKQLKEKTLVDVEGKASTQMLTEGNWRDGEVLKALKSILSFAKLFGVDREILNYGTIHVKKLETQKKEFRNLRAVWIALYEQVQAVDELDMATTRLRLRLPEEEVPDSSKMNVIEPAEIEQQKLKLLSDKTIGQNELRRKLGQLFYLKNLAKAQTENDGGINPEPCPICQRELGVEWSVMLCGHCYCLECIRVMVVQYSFGSKNRRLKCAMCRQTTFQSDISYVSTKKSDVWESDVRVKGSYSTKIEGVVGCVLQIHKDDPQGKILVFSTWTNVLGIISKAFTENDITHRCLYVQGKFQENLTSFKEENNVTALLLPIHSGANGLNLIEATYVVLVEPVLNPAQELQAIGRVHRIGQNKRTEIHRFLVKRTIEQKMHSILKSIEDSPSSHNTEENVLTIGHLTSLLQEEEESIEQSVTDMRINREPVSHREGGNETSTTNVGSNVQEGQEDHNGSTDLRIHQEPVSQREGGNETSTTDVSNLQEVQEGNNRWSDTGRNNQEHVPQRKELNELSIIDVTTNSQSVLPQSVLQTDREEPYVLSITDVTANSQSVLQTDRVEPRELSVTDVTANSQSVLQTDRAEPSELSVTDVTANSQSVLQTKRGEPYELSITDVTANSQSVLQTEREEPSELSVTDVTAISQSVLQTEREEPSELSITDVTDNLQSVLQTNREEPYVLSITDVTDNSQSVLQTDRVEPYELSITDVTANSQSVLQTHREEPYELSITDVTANSQSVLQTDRVEPNVLSITDVTANSQSVLQTEREEPYELSITDVTANSQSVLQTDREEPSELSVTNVAANSQTILQMESEASNELPITDVTTN